MLFLYDNFYDNNSVGTTGNYVLINSIRISNGIFDHLNLVNVLSYVNAQGQTINYLTDTTKPSGSTAWNDTTIINVTFDGTLDGGTISQLIANISYLAIQRQEDGSSDWLTLHRIYKNKNGGINANFIMDDTFTQSGVKYTYQIVPVDANGNLGTALQQEVLSKFNGAYIADASHIYKITYEYTLSNQRTQKNAVYEPYGSKYPFVAYNAVTNYDNGSVTAVLLAPTSNNSINCALDRNAQRKLVEEFNTWLTNGRAKILKDFNGLLKVVTVTNAVSNEYYKELGNGLASTTFEFMEIGNMTQDYLDKLNLSSFPIKIKS